MLLRVVLGRFLKVYDGSVFERREDEQQKVL